MKLKDLVTKLTELVAQDGKAELEAVDALHQVSQSDYQAIYDRGHGQATKDLNTKVTTAEAAHRAAQEKLTETETALADARKGKGGDVEQLREQHKIDIQREKDAAKAKETALTEQLKNERTSRSTSDLKAMLAGKVIDDYAAVVIERPDIRGRIRHREDGSVFVVQAGTEVELQVPAGKTPLSLLAEELIGSTPATLRLSGADGGSGATTGGTGSSGGYDPVAAGKKMAEATKPSAQTQELALR